VTPIAGGHRRALHEVVERENVEMKQLARVTEHASPATLR